MSKNTHLNPPAGHIATVLFLSLYALHCNSSDSAGSRAQHPSPIRPNGTEYNLKAQLDGNYVKGIRIEESNWSAVGPQQDVELKFQAEAMVGIGQFEFHLELAPSNAFDVSASSFVTAAPFVTLLGGIDPGSTSSRIKIGGANMNRSSNGDAVLGTLNLQTSSQFTRQTEARIRIVFFSMGPESQIRDNYSTQDLNMGVVVNQQ